MSIEKQPPADWSMGMSMEFWRCLFVSCFVSLLFISLLIDVGDPSPLQVCDSETDKPELYNNSS